MLLQTSLDLLVCTLQRVEVSMLNAVCAAQDTRVGVFIPRVRYGAAHARELIRRKFFDHCPSEKGGGGFDDGKTAFRSSPHPLLPLTIPEHRAHFTSNPLNPNQAVGKLNKAYTLCAFLD